MRVDMPCHAVGCMDAPRRDAAIICAGHRAATGARYRRRQWNVPDTLPFSTPDEPMRLFDNLKAWARRIKRDGMTLWFAGKHPRTPWYAKAIAVFVVAYALSPIDLIPDFEIGRAHV